jgi:hypothetical protein
MAARINRITTDLVFDDRWGVPYKGNDATMLETLLQFDILNTELEELYAPHFPPNAPDTDEIYVLLRHGKCFYGDDSACDEREYDPSVGFTKTLAKSGIDIQIAALITASRQYLDEPVYTEEGLFQLIDLLSDNLMGILHTVLDAYQQNSDQLASNASAVLFGLNSLAILIFVTLATFGTVPLFSINY